MSHNQLKAATDEGKREKGAAEGASPPALGKAKTRMRLCLVAEIAVLLIAVGSYRFLLPASLKHFIIVGAASVIANVIVYFFWVFMSKDDLMKEGYTAVQLVFYALPLMFSFAAAYVGVCLIFFDGFPSF